VLLISSYLEAPKHNKTTNKSKYSYSSLIMSTINSPSVAASVDLGSIEHRPGEDVDEEKKTGLKYLLSIAALSAAIGSFVFQILAMVVANHGLMYFAGVLACLLASAVGTQQVLISRMDTLRDVHNKLRDEVNLMTEENNELNRNVNDLQDEVSRVEDIEAQLTELAQIGNVHVNNLVSLVKENDITLKKQIRCVKASAAENILTSILRTDRDSDLQITDREVDILIMRLKHLEGVKVDENQLRESLKKNGGSISNLMKFFREIDDESNELKERTPLSVDMKSYRKSYRKNRGR